MDKGTLLCWTSHGEGSFEGWRDYLENIAQCSLLLCTQLMERQPVVAWAWKRGGPGWWARVGVAVLVHWVRPAHWLDLTLCTLLLCWRTVVCKNVFGIFISGQPWPRALRRSQGGGVTRRQLRVSGPWRASTVVRCTLALVNMIVEKMTKRVKKDLAS